MSASALLFNLGPGADAQKIRYDVLNGVLRSTRLIDDQGTAVAAPVPQPLASNIVNMKLQYGIDTNGDGLLDAWVSATPPWDAATLLTAPTGTINQIKAVRIGIVVRSEQFDKGYNQDFTWSIFDGVISGTYPKSVAPPGNWRYRVYESSFPLRNEIWNKQ
jgi:type IV pilus assembly protein PilW